MISQEDMRLIEQSIEQGHDLKNLAAKVLLEELKENYNRLKNSSDVYWTNEFPKEPGTYWYRELQKDKLFSHPIIISYFYIEPYGDSFYHFYTNEMINKDSLHGEWSNKPIIFPKEQEVR